MNGRQGPAVQHRGRYSMSLHVDALNRNGKEYRKECVCVCLCVYIYIHTHMYV